ncbi:MAG: protein serine/threonine phosphatase [Bacteroidetes bacterium]|jgi:tetratricopeptide (TPR) repeat protein|nr:protein serine/threonine phosphatase [Bacteroidota bacterium]
MKATKIKYLLVLLLFVFTSSSQNIDSLENILKKTGNDSVKLILLNKLADECELENINQYTRPAIAIAEKNLKNSVAGSPRYLFFKQHLASALNNTGFLAEQQGEASKALDYYFRAKEINLEINYSIGVALCLNNIALVYNEQGNKSKAIEFWHQALGIQEKANDAEGTARSLNNISAVYISLGDTAKAIEYLNKALAINLKNGFKWGTTYAYNNLGSIYNQKGDFDRALEFHLKSLAIKKELKDKRGISNSLINIGLTYANKNNIETAMKFFNESLAIAEEIGDKTGISVCLKNMSETMMKKKDLNSAVRYGERSLKVAQELGYPELIRDAAGILRSTYKNQNQPGKAYEMLELFVQMRDSINSRETRKLAIKKQFEYEYGKKEAELKAISKAEKEKIELQASEDKKRHRIIIFSVVFGLIIVSFFSIFLFRSLQRNKTANKIITAQKEIVEEQKKQVEEKQKEILDSIHYALRIQKSLLPTEKYIIKTLGRMGTS